MRVLGSYNVVAILAIFPAMVWQVVGLETNSSPTCVGRAEGYYADHASNCNKYLLCTATNSRGAVFSCPPGTRFHQDSLVCHHERNVPCKAGSTSRDQHVEEVDVEVRLGTQGATPTERSEEIGGEGKIRDNARRANNQTHQRIRPLTDLIGAPEKPGGNVLFPETGNTIWTPLPNLPGGKTVGIPEIKKSVKNHSATIIGGRKSLPTTTSPKFVREILRPKETTTPLQRVAPPSESSRVVYFPDKETPLEEKSVSQGINRRVRLGRVRGLISKSARDFNQKKRQEGSPYRRHAVRTTPPPVRESHWPTKVPVDHVTIPPSSASVDKWSQPSLALQDQWTSLGQAPEVVHPNTSRPEVSVNLPFTINSLKTGNYVEKTARLESIPFSRVVGVQARTGKDMFSKLIGLEDLLDLLTEKKEAVRLIPIPVSSREARFIEGLVEDNAREKTKQRTFIQRKANRGESQNLLSDAVRGGKRGATEDFQTNHQGWARETGSPEKAQEVLLGFSENSKSRKRLQGEGVQSRSHQGSNRQNADTKRSTEAPKYQIVYKSTQGVKSPQENKNAPDKGDNDKAASVVPSPRGHKSFFDEEKIRKFKLLAQEKAHPELQFGFQPIKKKKKKERGQPSTFFGKSPPSSEYDSFLDSLQAPRVLGEAPPPRPRSPATPRKSKPVPKQDRKSNLDFLGIFDTRQYFYIPNRRSDEAKTQKNSGVLAKIVKLFMGH